MGKRGKKGACGALMALYLVSDGLSMLGNSMIGVALPLVLLARTGDVLAAGSLAIICAVPQALFGILGGSLLDRVDRRIVSIVSDCVSALSVVLLPVVDGIFGLDFGWFVVLGLIGAVGDVPGMSARDALLPEICSREGEDLQRFVGVAQSLQSLIGVAGPACAGIVMSALAQTDVFWLAAGCSCAAALATAMLPSGVGKVSSSDLASVSGRGGVRGLLLDGLQVLFREDGLLRASTLLSLGITMALGGFQGIVLPAFFSQKGMPEMTGFLVSVMGAGLLIGSLVYTTRMEVMRRRTWLIVSLVGMSTSIVALALFVPLPFLIGSAGCLGFFAGPASALLGYFTYDRIPKARRGVGMSMLNVLFLVVAPVSTFVCSALIATLGIARTGFAIIVVWLLTVVVALTMPSLRKIDA